jgi:hypothetical protein
MITFFKRLFGLLIVSASFANAYYGQTQQFFTSDCSGYPQNVIIYDESPEVACNTTVIEACFFNEETGYNSTQILCTDNPNPVGLDPETTYVFVSIYLDPTYPTCSAPFPYYLELFPVGCSYSCSSVGLITYYNCSFSNNNPQDCHSCEITSHAFGDPQTPNPFPQNTCYQNYVDYVSIFCGNGNSVIPINTPVPSPTPTPSPSATNTITSHSSRTIISPSMFLALFGCFVGFVAYVV